MSVNLHPIILPTATPSRPRPAPQPVEGARDAVADQREAARRLVVSEQQRRAAELLASTGAAQRLVQDSTARRAVLAYEGTAKMQERDYVSRVLGISEFA